MQTEHVTAARAHADDIAPDESGERLAARWIEAVERVRDACALVDPSKPVLAHDLPTDVGGLLVLRTFELWAHLQDVCAATGRTCPAADGTQLALMSSRLMGALPGALFLRDVPLPRQAVRFVLTGAAPGCCDLPGVESDTPPLTIVVDTVDVCRVAARRLATSDLDVVVEGDAELAGTLLGALDAFARD